MLGDRGFAFSFAGLGRGDGWPVELSKSSEVLLVTELRWLPGALGGTRPTPCLPGAVLAGTLAAGVWPFGGGFEETRDVVEEEEEVAGAAFTVEVLLFTRDGVPARLARGFVAATVAGRRPADVGGVPVLEVAGGAKPSCFVGDLAGVLRAEPVVVLSLLAAVPATELTLLGLPVAAPAPFAKFLLAGLACWVLVCSRILLTPAGRKNMP